MTLTKSALFVFLLLILSTIVFAQSTSYLGYKTSFLYVTSCPSNQYYDTALLQCSPCPTNAKQKSTDVTQCDCINDYYYYGVNQGGGSLLCLKCDSNYVRSTDGFGCVTTNLTCDSITASLVKYEAEIDGSLYLGVSLPSSQPRVGSATCLPCVNGTSPDPANQRCSSCAKISPRKDDPNGNSIQCCLANDAPGGVCLTYVNDATLSTFETVNVYSPASSSVFMQQHLKTAFLLCRMNLNSTTVQSNSRILLSNATACQVLANIAAMQFYYGTRGYAYYYYDTFIWNSAAWTFSYPRVSIPFLQYPTTYYSEISSLTYSWIPGTYNQNDLLRIRLAKYSTTGQYLGAMDAYDSYAQLCGGGYTEGQAAFLFGAQFSKTCNIRADALWNSPIYETAFFDPYVVYKSNGSDTIIPCPVVIVNYQSSTGGSPNQNSQQSSWVYHRRFFLLDRISGITSVNGVNKLLNLHYAKSIQVITTLVSGNTYIQPPLIIIEYGTLTSADIGTNKIVQVSFSSSYQMNLDLHIRDLWIAFGVISFFGVLVAFLRTAIWHSRRDFDTIDISTIGKIFVYVANALATVSFILLAGDAIWWLVFYKRQDQISLIIPTGGQLASFTALIVIAFGLKTCDIAHLLYRQVTANMFFMDWEKPKAGKKDNVSIWRTYFVANEFHELQTFRRINLTFQLFFILLLLKVVNLENVATMQPGVNLFPADYEYQPAYNPILRVGIAFSMWLGTALVQYLFYVLFYQRFFEDKIINFIDLCAVSNISVFILTDNLYGYYIHGLSPHGTTDVNLKDLIMNLERESTQMSGKRGLQAKSEEQTFIMQISKSFYALYNKAVRKYQSQQQSPTPGQTDETRAVALMQAYQNLNELLCTFITHSLPGHHYIIRERTFLEKVFNYEFQNRNRNLLEDPEREQSILFVDNDKNLIRSIFAGHENSLFIWNMSTFFFIDYFATNYVLAAIITYILNFIAIKLCLSFARKNLAAKTLIPKNFLI